MIGPHEDHLVETVVLAALGRRDALRVRLEGALEDGVEAATLREALLQVLDEMHGRGMKT